MNITGVGISFARRWPTELPGIIDFKAPDGGLAIWANSILSIPLPALSDKLKARDIILSNGLIHNPKNQTLNATRLGFAWMNEKEATRAIDVLVDTVGKNYRNV